MPYPFPYKDLYIADDDYASSAMAAYASRAFSAETYWHCLVLLISQIRADGVMEGEAAKAIEAFAKDLDEKFKDRLQTIISDAGGLTTKIACYQIEIEAADDCLY